MELSWVSPALVGLGLVVSILLGWQRESKASGARDEKMKFVCLRQNEHSSQIEKLKEIQGRHGERISVVESRCKITHFEEK